MAQKRLAQKSQKAVPQPVPETHTDEKMNDTSRRVHEFLSALGDLEDKGTKGDPDQQKEYKEAVQNCRKKLEKCPEKLSGVEIAITECPTTKTLDPLLFTGLSSATFRCVSIWYVKFVNFVNFCSYAFSTSLFILKT